MPQSSNIGPAAFQKLYSSGVCVMSGIKPGIACYPEKINKFKCRIADPLPETSSLVL